MIESFELESGGTLIFEKVKHSEIVSIGFWFKNGSVDENINEKGYAHFIEHILFKGTSNRSTIEIARSFDKIGSNINAYTEKEMTCFYCTFPSVHIEYVIDIMCDMIFNPEFDLSEIEKEKNIIISEIREYEELPEENSYDLFLEKMWSPHSLGYKVTGEADDIKRIERDSIYSYYCSRYNPGSVIITAAGNFNEKTLADILNQQLKKIRLNLDASGNKYTRTKPVRNYSVDNIYNDSGMQIHFHTGTAFPALEVIENYYQFLIFSTLAGESMSSRLFQSLREDRGLCYSISSFRSFFDYYSMWNIYANTVPENMTRFIDLLNMELKNIKKYFFTQNELDDAKTHLEGGLILSQEDMENRMKRIARHFIFSGKTFDYPETLDLLGKISLNDIKEFLDKYLDNGLFNTLIYGNTESLNFKNLTISF